MMEQVFKIRSYGRMELAQMYFPQIQGVSAYRKLKRWLQVNPRLNGRILRCGTGSRSFTPEQVRLIVSELGEP